MPDYRLQFLLKASNQASQIFSQANAELAQLGQNAQRIGRDMTLGLTMPIIAMGTAAVKAAGQLDTEMKNIQSVSKDTNAETDALARSFIDMSMDMERTTDSAAGLAAGFYNIQGSGFAGAEGMMVLEAATMAASAGLTQTDVAAEAVTAKLNAYGESAEEAALTSDMMFRTVDIGVGTFAELANSLGYVVGTAAQAGISFDEISASLATMSKQGVDFQMGARALNMLILAMIDPSDEMAEALREIGFASGQAALDALGLAGVLQRLERAGYAGTEGMASLGLSTYSLRAALALTGEGAEGFAGDLDAMQESSGAAKDAFDIQVESFDAQVKILRNTIMGVLLPAGTQMIQEVLIPMAEELVPVIEAMAELDPETLRLAIRLAGIVAAMGPVISGGAKVAGALTAIGKGAQLAWPWIDKVAFSLATAAAGSASLAGVLTAGAVGLASASSQSRTYAGDLSAVEEQVLGLASSYEVYLRYMREADEGLRDLWGAMGMTVTQTELMDMGIVKTREEWQALAQTFADSVDAMGTAMPLMADELAAISRQGQDSARELSLAVVDVAPLWVEGWEMIIEGWHRTIERGMTEAQDLIGQGYEALITTTEAFNEQLLGIDEQNAFERQMTQIDFEMGRQMASAQYHQQVLEAEAAYQQDVLALQMQGKGEELGNLETAHQEELAQLAYRFSASEAQAEFSYNKQIAMAQVYVAREQQVQALANVAQLKEDQAYFAKQASQWVQQNEALFAADVSKYYALLLLLEDYHGKALDVERAAADAHVRLEEIKAVATQQGSEATALAIREVINAYNAAIIAAAGGVDEAQNELDNAIAALQNITLNLPPVPDWTAYMPDYSGIANRASRAAREATGRASSHVVDFEDLVTDAIAALEMLAGYEAPAAIAEGAEHLKDALITIAPILRDLDDVLDDTISREGMEKVGLFAQTVRGLAESIEGIQELSRFQRAEGAGESFIELQNVMMDLAMAFEIAQETWDEYLSKDQIAEIADFADSVSRLAGAMSELRSLGDITALGENWVAEFLDDFMTNLEALSVRVAELEAEGYGDRISMPFVELLGALGGAIGAAQEGLNAIVSRWQVGGMESRIDDFITDIDYVLNRLAEQETSWEDLDYSGVLAYLSGVVGEIADLVANLSTDFRSQMQPVGYELMMGIRDGIEEGGPDVLEFLRETLADVAAAALAPPEAEGMGGVPAGTGFNGPLFGGEMEPAPPGPAAPPLILAPVFIEADDYRDAGGEWDMRRLADDLMMAYEREMR